MDITRTLSYTHDVSHDIIYCNTMMMKEINFISLETTMKNLSYPQIVNYMPTSLQYYFLKAYIVTTIHICHIYFLHIYPYPNNKLISKNKCDGSTMSTVLFDCNVYKLYYLFVHHSYLFDSVCLIGMLLYRTPCMYLTAYLIQAIFVFGFCISQFNFDMDIRLFFHIIWQIYCF